MARIVGVERGGGAHVGVLVLRSALALRIRHRPDGRHPVDTAPRRAHVSSIDAARIRTVAVSIVVGRGDVAGVRLCGKESLTFNAKVELPTFGARGGLDSHPRISSTKCVSQARA